MVQKSLRLEDTYGAKIRRLLHVFLDNSVIRPSFKKSEGQLFDQVAKDTKSMFAFEKKNPWPLGQKVVPQIFERWSNNSIIEGNAQEGSDFNTIRIF